MFSIIYLLLTYFLCGGTYAGSLPDSSWDFRGFAQLLHRKLPWSIYLSWSSIRSILQYLYSASRTAFGYYSVYCFKKTCLHNPPHNHHSRGCGLLNLQLAHIRFRTMVSFRVLGFSGKRYCLLNVLSSVWVDFNYLIWLKAFYLIN